MSLARRAFVDSCHFGLEHLDDIIASARVSHGVSADLARKYLTQHIVFELGERDLRGLAQYLDWAAELDPSFPPITAGVIASANL